MKISQLNIYPIKSLRPISLRTSTLTPSGLLNDRIYILLKPNPKTSKYDNMFVGEIPRMALFHCALSTSVPEEQFTVSYHPPTTPISTTTSVASPPTIDIPFIPEVDELEKIEITLHTSPSYPAYLMPSTYTTYFSTHFNYPVHLAYIGPHQGISKPSSDTIAENWRDTVSAQLEIPTPTRSLLSPLLHKSNNVSDFRTQNITFSDSAPLLIVTEASLESLHPLLASPDVDTTKDQGKGEEKVILEKFRPNIVVSEQGLGAWDEDYWASLTFPSATPSSISNNPKIFLTSNCARCLSINVDLNTGAVASGPSGSLLKKMMRERRVDAGNKWTPIFGRYGFAVVGGELVVGGEVEVDEMEERERAEWNGIMPRLSKFPSTGRDATLA